MSARDMSEGLLLDEKDIQTSLMKTYRKLLDSGRLSGESLAKIKTSWYNTMERCKFIKQKLKEIRQDDNSGTAEQQPASEERVQDEHIEGQLH